MAQLRTVRRSSVGCGVAQLVVRRLAVSQGGFPTELPGGMSKIGIYVKLKSSLQF